MFKGGKELPLGGRVRCITPDAAMTDINKRGVSNMVYSATVAGGIWGYDNVVMARYFVHDGLVWEWEDRGDGIVRVYMMTWQSVKDKLGRYV